VEAALQKTSCMDHMDFMEVIKSDIMEKTLQLTQELGGRPFSEKDARKAAGKDSLGIEDFAALLSPAAENLLEEIARRAKEETRKHFGNAVSLYAPLYVSNYCENFCLYCGFNCKNSIARSTLSFDEIDSELKAIAETGLREILLLTGEARNRSNVQYIGEAVKLAKKHFSTIGIEVYPLNTDEYAYLHDCGADFVSVYQETYDTGLYEKYHPGGPKRVYPYRFNAQERALKGGMRGVTFGALLGLGNFRMDALAAGLHAYFIQQKYPHAEVAFSAPRLRAHINSSAGALNEGLPAVGERQLLQVFMAYRLFMPFSSINISSRERAGFRDNIVGLAANKISAGVKVGIGGHSMEQKGDAQFDVSDARNVSQVHDMILERGLQPVYTDYIRLN